MFNRLLLVPLNQEPPQRKSIFKTACKVKGKVCKVIVDSGSTKKLASSEMVNKLSLQRIPHRNPYKVSWLRKGMCRIMVNQTMALSGSEKPTNQGYVNLAHNFKVVLDFISKSCKKIICRKLNVVSKILGLIRNTRPYQEKKIIDWSKVWILIQYYKNFRAKIKSRCMSDHLNQNQMITF